MKTKLSLVFLLFFIVNTASAQELYGSEIRVKQLATYSVSATVDLLTEIHEEIDSIWLCWGDGACEFVFLTYEESFSDTGVKYHQFETTHTYGQQSTYTLTIDGCCWGEALVNIGNPETEEVHLSTDFFLSVNDPLFGENFMPSFSRGFVTGKVGLPINYDSNFFDPEGDEVEFEVCQINYVSNYFEVTDINGGSPNILFLDSLDGSFQWAAPQLVGNYVMALCVTERRNGMVISKQTRNILIKVEPPVSNEEIQIAREIEIFPNPVHAVLTIKMAENSAYSAAVIFDSLGRKVKEEAAVNEIDVAALSDGIYLLQLQFGDQVYNQKIVVNH